MKTFPRPRTLFHARSVILVPAAVSFFMVFATLPALGAGPKRLLAYYPSWAKDRTPSYSAAQIPYKKLTHIAHAFLLLDARADGSLYLTPDLLEPELISRAHAADVKVVISIGGADAVQQAAFAHVAKDDALRRAFARNLHDFVTANGYDGVDIDWEVPNAPEDTQPCILLMQALRDEMPAPEWLLSMAIPSNPRGWGTGFDVRALARLLDFINVMTYDIHGPWSDHAGHNSPLIQSAQDPGQEGSLADSIDLFENEYGVAPDQLNIGTAFYGYEFDGAAQLWGSCDCVQSTTSQNYGTYIKQRIGKLGWKAKSDKAAKAPYLVHQGSPGFITYDNAASTAGKVDYALGKRHLGGVFMWELSADYDGRTQDLLNAMYRAFLRYQHRP
jgi:chitinase